MRLVFESVLVFLLIGITLFMVGIPMIKLIKMLLPTRRDPVGEAQERLEIAKKEAEAARLNKETEKVLDQLYQETLEDDETLEEHKGKL